MAPALWLFLRPLTLITSMAISHSPDGHSKCAPNRMTLQHVQGADVEQMVEQAGIAQIQLGRLDEPLAEVVLLRQQIPPQRYATQFANFYLGTRSNSRVLLLTSITPKA